MLLFRQKSRRPWSSAAGIAVLWALLTPAPSWSAGTKAEKAARYYRQASQLLKDFQRVPEPELGPEQYLLVAKAFRKVYLTHPASSYSDDSLLAEAEMRHKAAQRFRSKKRVAEALKTYRFLVREYPHSKLKPRALAAMAEIEGRSAARQASGAPAAAARPKPPVDKPVSAKGAAKPRSAPVSVTDVRFISRGDSASIVIDMDDRARYRFQGLQNPERIFVDLLNARLGPKFSLRDLTTLPVKDDRLRQIRVAQNRRTTVRVVLDLEKPVRPDFQWLTNPQRLVVKLGSGGEGAAREGGTPAASAPDLTEPPKAALATSRGKRNMTRALGLKIGKVIIDAGHGGHDTGTIGKGGLREKDLVIDISRRLGERIESALGADVIYTRTTDRFVSLEERTKLANDSGADLFISIHANSARLRSIRGVETYYLSFTTNSWALGVASRENAASQRSIHELENLLSKIALTEKIEESREFAAHVQKSLYGGLAKQTKGLSNRGVRKAPFMVLVGANMPAILAEVGFLSNPHDEKLLRSSTYRQKIADHLLEGVRNYSDTLSKMTLAASASPPEGVD